MKRTFCIYELAQKHQSLSYPACLSIFLFLARTSHELMSFDASESGFQVDFELLFRLFEHFLSVPVLAVNS